MSLPCLPSLSRPAVTSQHLGHVGLRWTTPLTRLAGLVVQDPGRLCGKRRRPVFSGTGHPVLAVPWGVRKPETSTWCRVALSTFSEPVPGALPLGPAGHPRLAADSPSQAPRPPAPGDGAGLEVNSGSRAVVPAHHRARLVLAPPLFPGRAVDQPPVQNGVSRVEQSVPRPVSRPSPLVRVADRPSHWCLLAVVRAVSLA